MSTPAKLAQAHRLIMQSAEAPCMAIIRNKCKKSELADSISKMEAATRILKEVIGA